MTHFSRRRLDKVLEILPPREVSKARASMAASSHDGPVSWADVMESMLLESPSAHFLDSFALRNLVLSPPVSYEALSSLLVGGQQFIARCAILAPSGEESVLTFTLVRDTTPADIHTPSTAAGSSSSSSRAADGARGVHGYSAGPRGQVVSGSPGSTGWAADGSGFDDAAAAAMDDAPMGVPLSLSGGGSGEGSSSSSGSSGSAAVSQGPVWRLTRVRGEARHTELPTTPSPEFPPESVVEAQLRALREYEFDKAYALLSPAAREVVGPLGSYINAMARSRAYRQLVAHVDAACVRRCQPARNTYLEVVAVTGPRASSANMLFCFILTRHVDEGPLKDCWTTEWVKVVDDPKLLSGLGISSDNNTQGGEGGDSDSGSGGGSHRRTR